jgi:hypothetical protein
MKRIAIAVVGIAVLAAIAAATAGGQTPEVRVIKLKELVEGRTFGAVDNAPTGVSVGDSIAFSRLVAERSGKRVGRIDVTCVTTAGDTAETAHQACHGVLTLRNGQIALETAILGVPKRARIAVTGGTGAYVGASGVMISNVQEDTSELVTLNLLA